MWVFTAVVTRTEQNLGAASRLNLRSTGFHHLWLTIRLVIVFFRDSVLLVHQTSVSVREKSAGASSGKERIVQSFSAHHPGSLRMRCVWRLVPSGSVIGTSHGKNARATDPVHEDYFPQKKLHGFVSSECCCSTTVKCSHKEKDTRRTRKMSKNPRRSCKNLTVERPLTFQLAGQTPNSKT